MSTRSTTLGARPGRSASERTELHQQLTLIGRIIKLQVIAIWAVRLIFVGLVGTEVTPEITSRVAAAPFSSRDCRAARPLPCRVPSLMTRSPRPWSRRVSRRSAASTPS